MLQMMMRDARQLGWGELEVIGLDQPDMQIGYAKGFGMKVIALREYLRQGVDDADIVMFTDAYDVRVLATPQQVLDRFYTKGTRILLSAEKNCYPHPEAAPLFATHTEPSIVYKYVNSGAMIAYVGDLRRLIDEDIDDVEICSNDQAVYTGLYIKHQGDTSRIQLDTDCLIFQSLFMSHDDLDHKTLVNHLTGTQPLVWHGNGGMKDGDAFLMHVICRRPADSSHIRMTLNYNKNRTFPSRAKSYSARLQALQQIISDNPTYFPPYIEIAQFYYISDLFPAYKRILCSIFLKPTFDVLRRTDIRRPNLEIRHQRTICNMLRLEYMKRNEGTKSLLMYTELLEKIKEDGQDSPSELLIDAAWSHLVCGDPDKARTILNKNMSLKSHVLSELVEGYALGKGRNLVSFSLHSRDMHPSRQKMERKDIKKGRINIGYISSNFYDSPPHPLYLHPLLERFDRQQFNVFCYYDDNIYDHKTRTWMSSRGVNWVPIYGLSNEEVLRQIASHMLDVVVMLDVPSRERLDLWQRIPTDLVLMFGGAEGLCPPISCTVPIDDASAPPESSDSHYIHIGLIEPDRAKHHPLLRQLLKQCIIDNPSLVIHVPIQPNETSIEMYNDFPSKQVQFNVGSIDSWRCMDLFIDTYPFSSWLTRGLAQVMGIPILSLTDMGVQDFRHRLISLSGKRDEFERSSSAFSYSPPTMRTYEERLVHLVNLKGQSQVRRETDPQEDEPDTICPCPRPCTVMLYPEGFDNTTREELEKLGARCVSPTRRDDMAPDAIACNAPLNILHESADIPIVTIVQPELASALGKLFISACKIDKLRLVTYDPSVSQHLEPMKISLVILPPPYLSPPHSLHKVLSQPTSYHIISGESIIHHLIWANKDFTTDVPNNTFCISRNIYMTNTDSMASTFKLAVSKKRSFILVTHNSDANVTAEHDKYLSHPLLHAWYTQNPCFKHEKLHCLPIGIANSSWPHGDKPALARVIQKTARSGKKDRIFECYLGSDIKTNPKEREPTRRLTKYFEWLDQQLSYEDYLTLLAKHRFCVCPEGAGVDTHRFWECLYLGVVPIVKRNAWVKYWESRVPMIVVDSWEEINPVMLKTTSVTTTDIDYEKWLDICTYTDEITKQARKLV